MNKNIVGAAGLGKLTRLRPLSEEMNVRSRHRAGEVVTNPPPKIRNSFAPVYRQERSLRLRAGGRPRLATRRRAAADRHAARCASREIA